MTAFLEPVFFSLFEHYYPAEILQNASDKI